MTNQINQDDNYTEFFEKYGFTKSHSTPHPIYKDYIMEFTGMEADYCDRLESEIRYLKDAYERLLHKIDWMTTQEMYRMKDEIKKRDQK